VQDTISAAPTFTYEGIYSRIQGFGIATSCSASPAGCKAHWRVAPDMRAGYWAGYLQDDWKVTNSLTLNVGIRYEFAPSRARINNRSLIFNPEQGRLILAGQGVRPEIVDPDWNNLAGRVGFAWRPSWWKGLVMRGGAGTYYSWTTGMQEQLRASAHRSSKVRLYSATADTESFHARHAALVRLRATWAPSRSTGATAHLCEPVELGIRRRLAREHPARGEVHGSTGQKATAAPEPERGFTRSTGTIRSFNGCRIPTIAPSTSLTTEDGRATTQ